MEQTNPAGRLHTILNRAQTAINEPGNRNDASSLWARVFDVPRKNKNDPVFGSELLEVISRLIQFDHLITETEKSLLEIDGLPERYFRPFARIRQIPLISLNALNTDISVTIRSITEGDMTVLEFCSERLDQHHVEPIVDYQELQAIAAEVTQLFDTVKVSSINEDLQTFILDGLESIRRAIHEYEIRGPKRLKEELAVIIGNLAVNRDLVVSSNKDETLGLYEKLCYRFAAVVSFANDATALLAAAKVALLPSGG